MDKPTMFEPYPATPEIDVLPSYFPIPGYGILPINAFVLKAAEPVLVDTGLALLSDEFLPQLSSVIDPEDLRWLWLTHVDPDHIGSLHRLLDEVPRFAGHHDLPGRRETEPVSAVAAGSRLPVESGPESRRGRPHAHRRPAAHLRCPRDHRLLRPQVRRVLQRGLLRRPDVGARGERRGDRSGGPAAGPGHVDDGGLALAAHDRSPCSRRPWIAFAPCRRRSSSAAICPRPRA